MSGGSSASSVHLLGGRINIAQLWETSRQELKHVLGQSDLKKVSKILEEHGCVTMDIRNGV